jgi:hypothetical protein
MAICGKRTYKKIFEIKTKQILQNISGENMPDVPKSGYYWKILK